MGMPHEEMMPAVTARVPSCEMNRFEGYGSYSACWSILEPQDVTRRIR